MALDMVLVQTCVFGTVITSVLELYPNRQYEQKWFSSFYMGELVNCSTDTKFGNDLKADNFGGL